MYSPRRRFSALEHLEIRALLAGDLALGWHEALDHEVQLADGAADLEITLEQDGLLDLHMMTGGVGVGSAELLDRDRRRGRQQRRLTHSTAGDSLESD